VMLLVCLQQLAKHSVLIVMRASLTAWSGARPDASFVTVDSTVGALIEIRFVGSPSLDQIGEFEVNLATCVQRIARFVQRRVVVCTDVRACPLVAPEVSERIIRLMRNDSPHIRRNGFIAQNGAIICLQLRRMILESGPPDCRQVFQSDSALIRWLSEVTSNSEQTRLRMFLDSIPVSHASNAAPASLKDGLSRGQAVSGSPGRRYGSNIRTQGAPKKPAGTAD
jgi:hypothetical protein